MLEFLRKIKKKVLSEGDMNLNSAVDLAVGIESVNSTLDITTNIEDTMELEETVSVQAKNLPKYIIKEDAKIMSIPCDHKNILPQALLKIDKKLITDPNAVAAYINLSHLDSVDTIEEGYKEIIDIKDPCGGPGYIKGEILIEKVILIAGVHYSVLLYDTVTQSKVYDGDVEFLTAYSNLAVLPFGEEYVVDPSKVTANFTSVLTKVEDIPGVDFYLYTVDGEVQLSVLS